MGISGTCHGEGEARIQWVDKAILTSRYFRSLLSCTVWKTCSWRLCPAWPPSTAFLQLDTRRDRSTYGIKLPFLAAPWSSAKRPQGPRSSSQSALPPPAHSCPAVSADIPSTPAHCKALEEGQKDGCHFGVRGSALSREASKQPAQPNIKALIIRIGFWGPLYCIIIVRNPQNSIGNYLGPYITETP